MTHHISSLPPAQRKQEEQGSTPHVAEDIFKTTLSTSSEITAQNISQVMKQGDDCILPKI